MTPYADSNLFTRLYLPGAETAEALEMVCSALSSGKRLPLLWLHRTEVSNAFEQRVFISRSGGEPRVSLEAAAAAQIRFREDCAEASGYLAPTALPREKWESTFSELSLRHTAKHGFRTYDILHVSAALLLGCDTFWSYDTKCSKLAGLEGFQILKTKT